MMNLFRFPFTDRKEKMVFKIVNVGGSGWNDTPLPADVSFRANSKESMGKLSWDLLHSITLKYPENPTNEERGAMISFLSLFARFYPCSVCGIEFKAIIDKNPPNLDSKKQFVKWMCDVHNYVNEKLGKPKFDCNLFFETENQPI
jgi:hypothetical protein